MNRFINIIRSIIINFVNKFRRSDRLNVCTVQSIDDIKIGPNCLYIEARNGKKRWAYMRCPCGCGELITLNLMASHKPQWVIQNKNGNVSVNPSVWKKSGCKSHFSIKDNQIEWV